jgi:glycerol-3-phosphate dehydrogenase
VARELGSVDLLIIGGGINGAGIARDAAGRGLSVILCEKGDLSEGTSSRSGKYIHGGLRYLEYYEFRLVREALTEREILLRNAPHIVWPMRLVLPHSPEQRPAWLVRLGLFLYDHLGRRELLPGCRSLDLRTAPEGRAIEPHFTRGFEYSDCWVDDARLVVLNALDARERGACILPRTAAVSARRGKGMWRVEMRGAEGPITASARLLVNAAGPWVEEVLSGVCDLNSQRHVRLVKGSHIVVPKFWEGTHAYLFQHTDGRVIFVNPWLGDFCLIGTTDIPYEGRAEDVAIGKGEIDYLIGAVNRYTRHKLRPVDILHSFSGVRPLYDDSADNPSAVTREYVFDIDGGDGRPPLLSIFGGKITTYRRLAEHALEKLRAFAPAMGGPWTAESPLPGGDIPGSNFQSYVAEMKRRFAWLPDGMAEHFGRLYGTRAQILLEGTSSLGRHFGGRLYQREIDYLREHEWARTVDDILYRRTKHGLHLDERAHSAVARYIA